MFANSARKAQEVAIALKVIWKYFFTWKYPDLILIREVFWTARKTVCKTGYKRNRIWREKYIIFQTGNKVKYRYVKHPLLMCYNGEYSYVECLLIVLKFTQKDLVVQVSLMHYLTDKSPDRYVPAFDGSIDEVKCQ